MIGEEEKAREVVQKMSDSRITGCLKRLIVKYLHNNEEEPKPIHKGEITEMVDLKNSKDEEKGKSNNKSSNSGSGSNSSNSQGSPNSDPKQEKSEVHIDAIIQGLQNNSANKTSTGNYSDLLQTKYLKTLVLLTIIGCIIEFQFMGVRSIFQIILKDMKSSKNIHTSPPSMPITRDLNPSLNSTLINSLSTNSTSPHSLNASSLASSSLKFTTLEDNRNILKETIFNGLFQFPSCIFTGILGNTQFLNRSRLMILTTILSMVFLLLGAQYEEQFYLFSGVFLFFTEMCAVADFSMTNEVFPTALRDKSMGILNFFARLATSIAMIVVYSLYEVSFGFCVWSVGLLSLVVALCAYLVPYDARGKEMDS
eukprot:CAMPEP_0170538458 /NCGR_PEP_ID=MMETSP0209-20121228/103321_1 /TAXON_ID=665100 ORGANISM="Litonotus pictus, Strain P1" /NCGR_SAMPLE_ID=MMETSP0209 /ASSEMBLY_ACC=CAM_ASM_000301 /LENGTH=366 /DNA_ID=CAMNT_0010840151 /DNA_START=420 /DNA_END=1516 /DNA_ORIENTATION=+